MGYRGSILEGGQTIATPQAVRYAAAALMLAHAGAASVLVDEFDAILQQLNLLKPPNENAYAWEDCCHYGRNVRNW
jgi:hypothetical protein